jgi:GH15 family glucan-1,4-alpha-glucosidase
LQRVATEAMSPDEMPHAAGAHFPPIADYAFLSDCRTGALVAPDGAVEWMCLPRFDSPSVFAALLDRGAGAFRFGPRDVRVPVDRRYLPGTTVLETHWMGAEGWLVVRDALIMGSEGTEADDELESVGQSLMVRTARCLHGRVDIEILCEPAFGYATAVPRWSDGGDGRLVAEWPQEGPAVALLSDAELRASGGAAMGGGTLENGESCFACLSWGGDLTGPGDTEEARRRIDETISFWRRWIEGGTFPDHPWRAQMQRSALVLKGLIYLPTGATVAAPTTSLPETPGGERNWDYRYTWVRDASFTMWGLHVAGFDAEAVGFMDFIGHLCQKRGPDTQIMFGIGGEYELPERTLDHLSGYAGSRPVRVGNAAYTQRQNDVYGALLDAVYIHSKTYDGIPDHLWEVVSDQVDGAFKVWRQTDQGIWEARGEPKHYVSSKLMCWVALDRGVRLARERGEGHLASRWIEEADAVRRDILRHGVSKRGVFRQHYDTDALDASLLLMPLFRFLPPDDSRIRATVLAIADELTERGLVLRYRTEETDDGLSGREGTFLVCSFWLVSALSEIGERARARELCQRLLANASPLGLYAEELDAASGAHLGNFPQAFTHLGLINAVSHVIADDMRGERGQTAVFSELRGAA